MSNAQIDEAPRGLLNQKESQQKFSLQLYEAPEGLEDLVSAVWHVRWALPENQPYQQSNLPHPVQHIVLDPQRGSGLFGCSTSRFDYELVGEGQVIGLKLYPGFGRAFFDSPMSTLTDQSVDLSTIIGALAHELVEAVRAEAPLAETVAEFGRAVLASRGEVSQAMRDARFAVEFIESNLGLYRVDDLCTHLGLSQRGLQRLFAEYVGVTPKWVIDRYRMIEAVDVLNAGEVVNLSHLALELGYFDQAHFSKQFRAITGVSPSAYSKQ